MIWIHFIFNFEENFEENLQLGVNSWTDPKISVGHIQCLMDRFSKNKNMFLICNIVTMWNYKYNTEF